MRSGSVRNRYSILSVLVALLIGPLLADAQELLRDPTRPYAAKPVVTTTSGGSVATTFRVTAIFTSDLRRVAVVNGQRVIEGDRVDGATVVEIMADALQLNFQGKAITRRVLPNGFRQK
jgi:hypothetical protein